MKTSVTNKRFRKLINPKFNQILEILKRNKNINQSQLAKKMGISIRQTNRYLKTLEEINLIKLNKLKNIRGSPKIISLK